MESKMTKQILATAGWHADKAIAAYLSGDFDLYARHIKICDHLRRSAWLISRAA